LQKVSFSPAPTPQPVESYRYDAAGNIVEKFERGLTTTMTYDAANQLVSATRSHPASTASPGNSLSVPPSPLSLKYFYDAAGRQVRIEGPNGITDRHYGWLDKVIRLKKPDGTVLGFDYYPDGQIAAKGPLNTNESVPPASDQLVAAKAPAQKKWLSKKNCG
jgi:YD repeat-containing protein